MKNLITLSILVLASTFVFAQHKEMESWKELKDFHEVMSATYHPTEKGDYKPIRSRAAELVAKADALQRSKYPVDFDNIETRRKVKMLYASVTAVKNAVDKNDSDANIGKLLEEAHSAFHGVIGEKETHNENEKMERHDAH
jgi:hypothetical protein